jgi:2'-5' RNA ligase
MTPAEIRDRLASIGFDFETYANPLAAIHTTLKRLAEADEIKQASLGGKARYIWFQAPKADMLARIQARVNDDIEALQTRAARRKKR